MSFGVVFIHSQELHTQSNAARISCESCGVKKVDANNYGLSWVFMEVNGIDVGEMNKLLLEKIEELTLHIINLERQNMEHINALKTEIYNLKTNIK